MNVIIWPEKRIMSDDELMLAAFDSFFNHAHSYICKSCGKDAREICECEHAEVLPVYNDGTVLPETVEAARALLSDNGDVTFGVSK